MSVVIETTLGDITVDLYVKKRPRACLNFLKLCKIKYYNYNLFHTVTRGFIAQTGDPTGSRTGGESIFGVMEGPLKRYFEAENNPRIKHTIMGLISFVGNEDGMIGSQFFFTLGQELTYLDEKHCVFGEVVEGLDVLEIINEAICDNDDRPYQDIRITHTVVLDDSFPDPVKLKIPERSPSPSAERLQGGRIAPDEEIDETAGKTAQEINEMIAEREAKARATILEMVGDIPDAEMAPPENVLFVCKLNPVTSDDDLEIIFSRFGKIKSCEVIRDRKSGDSLQYAFVEFEDKKSCEDAYFKMDNVLIDDRRIHVDFSQSVSKIRWLGKGRGVRNYGEKDQDLGKGKYHKNGERKRDDKKTTRDRRSPDKRQESNRPRDRRVENRKSTDRIHENRRSPVRREDTGSSARRRDDWRSAPRKRDDRNGNGRSNYERYKERDNSRRREDIGWRSNPDRYDSNSRRKSRSRSPRYRRDNRRNVCQRDDRIETKKTQKEEKPRKKNDESSDSSNSEIESKKGKREKTKKCKKKKVGSSDSSDNETRKRSRKNKKKKKGSSPDSSESEAEKKKKKKKSKKKKKYSSSDDN